MVNLKKKVLAGALVLSIIGSSSIAFAGTYKVQAGDSYWKISQKFDVDINKLLSANGANENTMLQIGKEIIIPEEYEYYTVMSGDTPWLISQKYDISLNELLAANNLSQSSYIYVGQKLKIPLKQNSVSVNQEYTLYTVKSGDTPWIISNKFRISLDKLLSINNLNHNSVIYIGQKIKIPTLQQNTTTVPEKPVIPEQPTVTVTYKVHTVQKGENFWSISNNYGIQVNELLKANNATSNTVLSIGDKIKIPVYNVPVMKTLGEKYGEYLDWWKCAQYVIPIGAEFKVIDFYTGKSFMAKRTTGANHADVETLTAQDTAKMKEIWGGSFSWKQRPAIIEYNGRRIAASVSSMPHAGNENAPGGVYTSWRSDGYGPGLNFDYVKGNNINGHFDIHFLNSTRHKDGQIDETHQENIKISAGIIK